MVSPGLFLPVCCATLSRFSNFESSMFRSSLYTVWEGGYMLHKPPLWFVKRRFSRFRDAFQFEPGVVESSWFAMIAASWGCLRGWGVLVAVVGSGICVGWNHPVGTTSPGLEWRVDHYKAGGDVVMEGGRGCLLRIGGRHMCRLKPPWWDHITYSSLQNLISAKPKPQPLLKVGVFSSIHCS